VHSSLDQISKASDSDPGIRGPRINGPFVTRKDSTAQAIHDDLIGTFGQEVIAYIMVTKYLREVQISPRDVTQYRMQLRVTSTNQIRLF
jgi:hypothetical protein